LKPTVNFEPVNIGGVIIQYATGFNAAFIENNKIGPGAFIEIIRSGDVIPYIKEVKSPAETPSMPSLAWHWNETHVDAILDNASDNVEVQKRALLYFAKTLEIGYCGEGNVAKLYEVGVKTPHDLLNVKASALEGHGFAKASSEKLVSEIEKAARSATLAQWATGSGIFGRGLGIKRVESALKVVPETLEVSPDLVGKIVAQGGWSPLSAKAFVDRLPEFRAFMKKTGIHVKSTETNSAVRSAMKAQVVLFTGFHPKDLEEAVIANGGELADTFSKKVTIVVVKDGTVDNAKTQKAKAAGIPVKTAEQFRAMI